MGGNLIDIFTHLFRRVLFQQTVFFYLTFPLNILSVFFRKIHSTQGESLIGKNINETISIAIYHDHDISKCNLSKEVSENTTGNVNDLKLFAKKKRIFSPPHEGKYNTMSV